MLPCLRHRFLARFVLAWFLAVMGVAGAAPAIAGGGQLVCSASGAQLVPGNGDDGSAPTPHVLKCAACFASIAPPPPIATPSATHVAAAAPPIAAPSRVAGDEAAHPWSARAPPLA